jgi:L-amino acid N-acyltransferase YncA
MNKKMALKDGTELTVRELALDDLESLMKFYVSLPKNDRKYLRIDVTDKDLVKNRILDAVNKKDIRLVITDGNQIIASGTLEFSREDWRKNQGELRLIVARKFQRRGVGLMLARELYHQAAENGVKKLVVKMMKPQTSAQNMVRKLGFHKKRTIPDYVTDQFGKLQDLVIMTCDMKEFWKEMEHDHHDSDWRRCR